MYYSQLRAFHAVATQGGFSKAAVYLRLTQPTLSDQVRKLEKDFDIILFNRNSRTVSLTEAGRQLLAITNRMFECEDEALEFLARSQNLLTGALTLSADAPFHVLQVLGAYRNRYPGVNVTLKIGNSEDILNQLFDFEADIGVFAQVPDDPRLKTLTLREDPLVAVVAGDHPWAARGAVKFRELAGEPLVLRERGSTTRRLVEDEFARLKITPGPVLEVEGRESIREAVATGNGIGFVSRPEFGFDSRVAMVELQDCRLPMHEYMVCLQSRAATRVVSAFWEMAETQTA